MFDVGIAEQQPPLLPHGDRGHILAAAGLDAARITTTITSLLTQLSARPRPQGR